jgi:phage terminase large subunit
MEICKKLAVESKDKDITLLCYEKEQIFCHRYYVKQICEHELSKLQPIEFRKDKNYN